MLCHRPNCSIYFIMRYQQIPAGFSERQRNHLRLGLMILLYVGVLTQMLGVPLTLWDLAETADTVDPLTASILEGFSIPSTPLSLSPNGLLSTDYHPDIHRLLASSELFHPPIL